MSLKQNHIKQYEEKFQTSFTSTEDVIARNYTISRSIALCAQSCCLNKHKI